MIFDLVKKAKEVFINKSNTGVEADNVEDAIKLLNTKVSRRVVNNTYASHGIGIGHNLLNNLYQRGFKNTYINVDDTYYLLFAPSLADYDNFDNLPCGISFVGANAVNAPVKDQRFLCLTFTNTNGYYVRQIAYSDNTNNTYSRVYNDASQTWGSWETK